MVDGGGEGGDVDNSREHNQSLDTNYFDERSVSFVLTTVGMDRSADPEVKRRLREWLSAAQFLSRQRALYGPGADIEVSLSSSVSRASPSI